MSDDYGLALFAQHARALADSGITPEHARARGYVTVDTKVRLDALGITPPGRRTPGLLVPQLRAGGATWGYQYRPDQPRERAGKPVKYETPTGQRNGIDVPPGVGALIGDPTVTLWVTEGVKKADSAALAGLACVALPGVWSWRGTNERGGKTAVPDWQDVALNGRRVVLAFDSDVTRKASVRTALTTLAAYLTTKGADVAYLHLPDDDAAKTGLDDFLTAGGTATDLLALVRPEPPAVASAAPVEPPAPDAPVSQRGSARTGAETGAVTLTLDQVHAVFRRWLGDEYDLDALDAVLAAAAVEQLDGDPVWLLVVSGSGNAKTETVAALAGAGAHLTSTITSEGALLSATSKKEQAQDATGGLLRKIGPRGLLVIKDVTSILSMNRDARAAVLAALREVYDGRWERNVGTDGGRTLTWDGRIVLIGAVTTAYDAAHAVIAAMGDRFALVRVDSNLGRMASGRQALANVGSETTMRPELAAAAAGVLANLDPSRVRLTEDVMDDLLAAADVVTLARTAVERDYRGQVVEAHQPEMPTRFAKMLGQIVRGGLAIGMEEQHALAVALRVARDSMPPLRLLILLDVADHPGARTSEVTKRLQRPRSTVDRVLQELHLLGLLEVEDSDDGKGWQYAVAESVTVTSLALLRPVTRFVTTQTRALKREEQREEHEGTHPPTNISGEGSDSRTTCPHGEVDGDQPDPWVKGRLSCPQCRLTAGRAS